MDKSHNPYLWKYSYLMIASIKKFIDSIHFTSVKSNLLCYSCIDI
jgi:hypothetical protein